MFDFPEIIETAIETTSGDNYELVRLDGFTAHDMGVDTPYLILRGVCAIAEEFAHGLCGDAASCFLCGGGYNFEFGNNIIDLYLMTDRNGTQYNAKCVVLNESMTAAALLVFGYDADDNEYGTAYYRL